jgi:hypothetical protein
VAGVEVLLAELLKEDSLAHPAISAAAVMAMEAAEISRFRFDSMA